MNNTVINVAQEQINVEHLGIYSVVKRLLDIFFSLIGIWLLLFPVSIIVKVLYLLNGDHESIFYAQYRIGKNGNLFKFYKFRSMVPNSEEVLQKLLKEDKKAAREYKINKKLKDDPRITKVGKFLRKTSLDELPQLVNIFDGDMSIIGNRPYLPREIDDMGYYYKDIIKTKPGLTGYWQISGRSNTTFETRCKLEKYYSNNWNMVLDTKIFFKTFYVVFFGRGAK